MLINILLLLVCLILLYVIRNLLRKVELYEDFVADILEDIKKIVVGMQSLDIRGSFESDDEVGIIFKAMKSLVDQLKLFLGEE